jgi:hypothetical protein
VALNVLSSLEYRTELVESFYQKFLRRSSDTGGLAFFVNLMQQGRTDQQVISDIVGSPEYIAGAQSGLFPP